MFRSPLPKSRAESPTEYVRPNVPLLTLESGLPHFGGCEVEEFHTKLGALVAAADRESTKNEKVRFHTRDRELVAPVLPRVVPAG